MALAACERHFDSKVLRAAGYAEYIPASQLLSTVRCGTAGCWNKAAIVLKPGERGVVKHYLSFTFDITDYHRYIVPL